MDAAGCVVNLVEDMKGDHWPDGGPSHGNHWQSGADIPDRHVRFRLTVRSPSGSKNRTLRRDTTGYSPITVLAEGHRRAKSDNSG